MTDRSVDQALLDFADLHNASRRLGFAAETHWYFFEANATFRAGRFLASALCAFNGIEASVRWLHREHFPNDKQDLEDVSILSHAMLRNLRDLGYQVEALAFPGELDFLDKLKTSKPHVEFLRQRNNVSHGNVTEFFQVVPETGTRIFTPECLRGLAETLQQVSDAWTREIERFRQASVSSPSPNDT